MSEPPDSPTVEEWRMGEYLDDIEMAAKTLLTSIWDGPNAVEAMEDDFRATGNRWAGQDAFKKSWQVDEQRLARAALADAVLHLGRQAIAVAFDGPDSLPGRQVTASLPLAAVVWSGRNQAHHVQEGGLRRQTAECFETLAAEAGEEFSRFRERSLSFEVLRLLGWREFETMRRDLLSLCRGPAEGSISIP